jgi:hypothetical protein
MRLRFWVLDNQLLGESERNIVTRAFLPLRKGVRRWRMWMGVAPRAAPNGVRSAVAGQPYFACAVGASPDYFQTADPARGPSSMLVAAPPSASLEPWRGLAT